MASGKSLQVEVVSHEGRRRRRGRPPPPARVGEGTVTVSRADEVVSFQVSGGFASVDSDFVTVVADHATVAEQ